MQTFLPYPSFAQSARSLDRNRLGKQRVECLQILYAITGHKVVSVHGYFIAKAKVSRWRNHPAVKMWVGHEWALVDYAKAVIAEWASRGYRDNVAKKLDFLAEHVLPKLTNSGAPGWLGTPEFHAAHRSNLLRKNSPWYGKLGWTEPSNLPYAWPGR